MISTDRFDVDEQLLEAFHLAALHVVLVEAAVATQVDDFTRVVDAGGRQATQGIVELRCNTHRKHADSHRSMQTTIMSSFNSKARLYVHIQESNVHIQALNSINALISDSVLQSLKAPCVLKH